MIALIDADSILYVIGYHNRDLPFDEASKAVVETNVDHYVRAMLQQVQATHYLGVFSSPQCFRNRVYKYAPYKGNRPPKPEFMVKWESTMKEYLKKEWGFIIMGDLEADDVVSALQEMHGNTSIVLSPDKDLRQNPGLFYDYKKNTEIETVTVEQARKTFYLSMLTGDSVDNVKGVAGIGLVNATKLLASCNSELEYESVLHDTYQKFYGSYYGPIILQETRDAIQMMSSTHRFAKNFLADIALINLEVKPVPESTDDFTNALSELGW